MIHRLPKKVVKKVTDMLANNQHVLADLSWAGNRTYSRANQSIRLHTGDEWSVFLVAEEDENCTVMGAENIPPEGDVESSEDQEYEWAKEAIRELIEDL